MPRISITVASGLGVITVLLLIAFIHHISQMIQVSHLTADIGRDALKRVDNLYPESYGEPAEDDGDADEALERWRDEGRGALVTPARPGYVQLIGVDELVDDLDEPPERLAILVRPGDFVSVDTPLAEVWPPAAGERCASTIRGAVAIGSERTIQQDVHFAIRQLTDIAVKAVSTSINDPTTATTCIGYIRSILVRLAARRLPDRLRRFPDRGLEVIVRRRTVEDHLEAFVEIARYGAGDGRVAGELLGSLQAVVEAAREAGSQDRMEAAESIARTIGARAMEEATTDRDRESVERLLEELEEPPTPVARSV